MTKKCPKCCNVIRNVAVRCDVCGYIFGGAYIQRRELRRCRRCIKGYIDYPTCIQICPTCRGTTYIRV